MDEQDRDPWIDHEFDRKVREHVGRSRASRGNPSYVKSAPQSRARL